MTAKQNSRGLTLPELLVVMALAVGLFFITFQMFSKFNIRKALDAEVSEAVATLSEARSLTLLSKNDSEYGVRIASDHMILFKGQTFVASDPDNMTHFFDGGVIVSTIMLNGGGTDIIFKRLTGEAAEYGTIMFTLVSDPSRTKTITVQETGIVESN